MKGVKGQGPEEGVKGVKGVKAGPQFFQAGPDWASIPGRSRLGLHALPFLSFPLCGVCGLRGFTPSPGLRAAGLHPFTRGLRAAGLHPFTPSPGGCGLHPFTPSLGGCGLHPFTPSPGGCGLHPFTPSPGICGLRGFTPSPGGLRAAGLHPFTPSPLHPFTRGLRATGLHCFTRGLRAAGLHQERPVLRGALCIRMLRLLASCSSVPQDAVCQTWKF